jgi:hypothetical protein
MSDIQGRGMDELIQILITTKISLDGLTNKLVSKKNPMTRDELVRYSLELDVIRVNVRVVYKELVHKFPEEYLKILHTPISS